MVLFILLTTLIVLVFIGIFLLYSRSKYLKTSVHESIQDKVILKISVPLNNDKKPGAAELFFGALHGSLRQQLKGKDHFSFEIVANKGGIYFVVVTTNRFRNFIENQIYGAYPEAQIALVNDYALFKKGFKSKSKELGLLRENFFPINTFYNFENDPLSAVTGAVSKLPEGYEVWIQILVRPVSNYWQEGGKRYVKNLKDGLVRVDEKGRTQREQMDSDQYLEVKEIIDKNNKPGFQFVIRIVANGPDELMCEQFTEDLEASLKQFAKVKLNEFSEKRRAKRSFISKALLGKRSGEKLTIKHKYQLRFLDERENGILNTSELASLYHLPNSSVKTPNIAWAKSKKLEIPTNLPTSHARIFALTDYRNTHVPFGIKKADRSKHIYLLGKTGTGKTTLIKQFVYGDILEGEGFAIVDPHGDLIDQVLDIIPENRLKDVIIIDPSDTEFPIGLNMLDPKEGEPLELLADGIVLVFKKFFGNSWGPRLQYILTNTILTLLHCQNVSLLAVQRMLVDENYRKFLLKQVKDPFLVKFWEEEYREMAKNPRLLAEAISPINNKVGRFLNSPMVRNMVGQVRSRVDFRELMDEGKILLVNLSQGKIGEENTSLLGGMIITRLYTAAMQRANVAESERRPFNLYVDEFQNFATDSFVKILSEARKYGLNLFVTHQFIDQIEPQIQDAIFGNVGTLMSYVVGQKDGFRLQREFAPNLSMEDLVNLERYRIVIKLNIDGSQSAPFTAIAMPPRFKSFGLKDKIIATSRENYSDSRVQIEQKINKWAGQEYSRDGNLIQNANTVK